MLRDDGQAHVSSFCSGGGCVWVSLDGGEVVVTDRGRSDTSLRFPRDEWGAFLAGVKAGEFDLPIPRALDEQDP
jgi:hypothetical protein